MNRRALKQLDSELREYLESMVEDMGRPERRAAMAAYVTGLLLDGERKSIQPMAARLVDDASETEAMRQRLQECVVISTWAEAEVFRRLATKFEREFPGIDAYVIDDTGFPKKGKHSAGVARQYSGTLGRIDNCQVATSLHLAGEAGSACIGMRLYLPQAWAEDSGRRKKAGVPEEVRFEEKWRISLAQLDAALSWGGRRHVVLADCAYGDCREFRAGLLERGLPYVLSISGDTVVWPPGRFPTYRMQKGRPPVRYRTDDFTPEAVSDLAASLKYRTVRWREGSRGWRTSRFAAVRIKTAHRHGSGAKPGEEEWLMCEWPEGETAPTKFHLSNLPPNTSLVALVRLAKLRWRVERDYQEMKQEIGLDHFEGRTWRGFHHHAALCAAAHGFLALRRALFPPEQTEVDAA
jgi:SRSO17 transposase